LRSPLRTLLQEEFYHVPVLSFAEISNAAQVKVLGRFELEDDLEEAFEDEHDQGLDALDNEDAA
jgi:type III secretion protein V